MKDTIELLNQLDLAYEPTPEAFHSRVQATLAHLKCAPARRPARFQRAAVLAAALVLFSAIAAAANSRQIMAFLTNTMAHHRVLVEAESLLHVNADAAVLGDCKATVSEWMCDGNMLYVAVEVTDPALAHTGDSPVYSEGLNRYAMEHGPGAFRLSQGSAASASWAFRREDDNQIIYTVETSLADLPSAFTVTIPVVCSAGTLALDFDVHQNDFGRVRTFEPSALLQADGYTAQITQCSATALHTYATLELRFEKSVPVQRRQDIASVYLEGMGVAKGNGEELLLACSARWSEDGLACTLELRGNPQERYPETMLYCPRPGMEAWEGGNDLPLLSTDGAIVMLMKEGSR